MHSEGEIKQFVRILVEKYGELTTSELKEKMSEVVDYDSDDLKKSSTRKGEIMILQRIGNIVSHQKDVPYKIYNEGIAVTKDINSKKKDQAIFSAITGIGDKVKEISKAEKQKRKKDAAKPQRTIKKIDWNVVNERKSKIGAEGELFVYNLEQQNAKAIFSKLDKRIVHISAKYGDGFGYDILSVDKNGDPVYIEVKTTTSGEDTPFYISRNEYDFFLGKVKEGNAFLYRVYDFDPKKNTGKIKKIPAKDLINNYNFEGISFCATKKKKVQK